MLLVPHYIVKELLNILCVGVICMNYGHLELRIEELLQEKGISKNTIVYLAVRTKEARLRFVRNWIYRGQILTDIAEMNFKDWMRI